VTLNTIVSHTFLGWLAIVLVWTSLVRYGPSIVKLAKDSFTTKLKAKGEANSVCGHSKALILGGHCCKIRSFSDPKGLFFCT
jgi:hypothetical protein